VRRLGLVGVLGISLMLGGCETLDNYQRALAGYAAKEAWKECSQKRPRYCVLSAMYATRALTPYTTSEDTSIRNRETP
jgi:hypothetical protein